MKSDKVTRQTIKDATVGIKIFLKMLIFKGGFCIIRGKMLYKSGKSIGYSISSCVTMIFPWILRF